jgi:hypothetical protein
VPTRKPDDLTENVASDVDIGRGVHISTVCGRASYVSPL